MQRAALLSVSDRTGIVEFARALHARGFLLLATSGTARALAAADVPVTAVEVYTGQREILDGRVKTLHPKVHAGLLARREVAAHREELEREQIAPIDVCVVNLYPFVEKVESQGKDEEAMVEFIDVGGPTMLRAAAKNFSSVLAVIDPADYPAALEVLEREAQGERCLPERRALAAKVFAHLAYDNLEVARYLSREEQAPFSRYEGMMLERAQPLRYGENPHQHASFFRSMGTQRRSWHQLHGKELSYNNLLDFDAALRISHSLTGSRPSAVIVKHLNPCGAALADSLIEALLRAKRSDPRSHFGGIIALNREVTPEVAEEIRGDFAEVVLAPGYQPEALEILQRSKNLRVMQFHTLTTRTETRTIEGGVLMQQPDEGVSLVGEARQVSARAATARELDDLQFAWVLCAHVKSNAIVIVRDNMLLGVGAGQMSRVDSVELAIHKSRIHDHEIEGAVAASDAFFPFPDGIETLGVAGVRAVIAPGGAKRDEEVVASADRLEMALLFANDRHFRH